MMYGSWFGSGSLILLHLHCFFGLLILIGFLGTLIWLYKFANKENLKKIIWSTLVIGVIGALLTAPWSYKGWNMMYGRGGSQKIMMQQMYKYLQEESAENPNWTMQDMMNNMQQSIEKYEYQ